MPRRDSCSNSFLAQSSVIRHPYVPHCCISNTYRQLTTKNLLHNLFILLLIKPYILRTLPRLHICSCLQEQASPQKTQLGISATLAIPPPSPSPPHRPRYRRSHHLTSTPSERFVSSFQPFPLLVGGCSFPVLLSFHRIANRSNASPGADHPHRRSCIVRSFLPYLESECSNRLLLQTSSTNRTAKQTGLTAANYHNAKLV